MKIKNFQNGYQKKNSCHFYVVLIEPSPNIYDMMSFGHETKMAAMEGTYQIGGGPQLTL